MKMVWAMVKTMNLKVRVKNLSDRFVERGGRVFPPKSTTELKLNKYKYKEVKACVYLHVLEVKKEEEEKEAVDTPKNEKEVFVCRFCDKEYKTTRGLNNHLKKEHGEVIDDE